LGFGGKVLSCVCDTKKPRPIQKTSSGCLLVSAREELIEKNTNPDIKKYLLLLYASAANILSPLNPTMKNVYDEVRGYQRTILNDYQEKTATTSQNGKY
jgi:hypothetical protein